MMMMMMVMMMILMMLMMPVTMPKLHLAKLEEDLRARALELGLDLNWVHLLAYLDDITVLVPSVLASEAQAAAAAALSRFGLQLRTAKTQAWSKGAACPASLQEYWRSSSLTQVGVPLGEPLPTSGIAGAVNV